MPGKRKRGGHKAAVGFDPERGAFLKKAREDAGYTQLEAFAATKVNLDVIAKAEQGRDLRTSTFLALVSAYGAVGALVDFLADYEPAVTGSEGAGGNRAGRHAG